MAENSYLIAGNLVQDILPSHDQRFKKIVLKINSKLTQIGDDNKVIGLDIPRNRSEASDDGFPNVGRLNLNGSESKVSTLFIQANTVQLNLGSNNSIEIEVKSDEASCLQIGDRCKIHLRDEGKAEVNSKVGKPSGCRRELFAPTLDPMTESTRWEKVVQPKLRKRKPANKKVLSSNNGKSEKQARTPTDSAECLKLYHNFFHEVQRILHPLRDNAKWSSFDEKWNELLATYGSDPVWKALLKLELGIRISYHSKFHSPSYLDEAERILLEGREIVEVLKDCISPSIKQFFKGRCYCYLSSVYRRNKLYGRAQAAVEKAEQIFNNSASTSFLYDKATVFYEKGSRYHEFDKNGVGNKEAKENFEKCYELCRQVRRETGCDFIEKGRFALLKKVMLLLGCATKHGRKRKITDEDLEEAKKCIDEFDKDKETRTSIPISEQLQLLLAKSDSYFRMNDFANAEEKVLQAVDLADQHGFDSGPARKRLKDIDEVRQVVGQPKPKQSNYSKSVDHVSCDADGSASQSTGTSD